MECQATTTTAHSTPVVVTRAASSCRSQLLSLHACHDKSARLLLLRCYRCNPPPSIVVVRLYSYHHQAPASAAPPLTATTLGPALRGYGLFKGSFPPQKMECPPRPNCWAKMLLATQTEATGWLDKLGIGYWQKLNHLTQLHLTFNEL